MNRMGYDAVMLGNHEFDNGVDTLATILQGAQFPVVCANYDVKESVLEGLVLPYTVIRRQNVRIGVFGIGIDPAGLIAERNFAPLQYLDPIATAQDVANTLKNKEKCDVIVCLSHQGTHPSAEGKLSDVELAQATRNIDIIIGAHTHKTLTNVYIPNLDGDSVFLAQMGKSGARIGKIQVEILE
jgi:5'-nucleotidase